MKNKHILWVVLLIILAAGLAFAVGRYTAGSSRGSGSSGDTAPSPDTPQTWTCSMHPQVKQPNPGKCPICAMDLIPLKTGGDTDLGPREIRLSPAAETLAEVKTAPAEKKFVSMTISLSGQVDYDETRVRSITSRVNGRLERVFADYTGIAVTKKQHMVNIYSPQLYAAQEELIQAVRAKSSGLIKAARKKLSLYGLLDSQIKAIEQQQTARPYMEIKAPMSGIVIEKKAIEGMYVNEGTLLYRIADLTTLWVRLDVYEKDLSLIRYGQDVAIRTQTHGDQTFKGWVSFIDPVLDPATRTVKVRVVVDNRSGRLKPNMFVRADIQVTIGKGGDVVSGKFRNKWICPMHPRVVKEQNTGCPICGMDLVRSSQLGYTAADEAEPPLVVPVSAVLLTGRRAVVYTRADKSESRIYRGVEIEVGPRAGAYYIVRSGLKEGDRVVVQGAFKIDSELQIHAKPSMMNPGENSTKEDSGQGSNVSFAEPLADKKLRKGAEQVVTVYLDIQAALAEDQAEKAKKAADRLIQKITDTNPREFSENAQSFWKTVAADMKSAARRLHKADSLKKQRESFSPLSGAVETLIKGVSSINMPNLRKAYCPMAFDNKGGYWIQQGDEIRNSYFGSSMLRCGEITEKLTKQEPRHESE